MDFVDVDNENDTQTQSTVVDTEDDRNERSDMRNVPKSILKQFIEVYRAHPSLWQIKNKEVYNNRNLKNIGYLELLKIWKKFDSDANMKIVKAKIQSLRGSFRKELRKVEKSERSGKGIDQIYKSNLWYFNSMMFLIDYEVPAESVDNIDAASASDKNTASVHVPVEDIVCPVENSETNEDEMTHPVPSPATIIDKRRYENIDQNMNPQKKRKITEERQRKIFMTKCTEALTAKVSDSEALAQYLSLKLEKVSNLEQKMYAEALLTKVMNRAILNRLTEFTDLTETPNYYSYSSSVPTLSSNTRTTLSPSLVTLSCTNSVSQESQNISSDGATQMSDALQELF